MKILVVEDEIKTVNYLCKGLSENNFLVEVAYNGEDGLFKASHSDYDLLILDVMLPKLDGFSVVRNIRALKKKVRILLLSARGSLEDKVEGLNAGADDYLVKPFAFSELLARVHSLLRREDMLSAPKIRKYSDLKMDLLSLKVEREQKPIELTAKEFQLLNFLIDNTGRVLTRTLIAERVWDIHFDSDTNVIDVAIRRLRQKIDEPFNKKFIHTVRGVGYVFEER